MMTDVGKEASSNKLPNASPQLIALHDCVTVFGNDDANTGFIRSLQHANFKVTRAKVLPIVPGSFKLVVKPEAILFRK